MYKKTNPELYRIICLFYQNNLSYNLFKCEHIFAGENKNLDILFQNKKDYDTASQKLEEEGYILYMSEKVEKYKKMYILFREGIVYAIHIHREIAWHGVKVIDKRSIFARKRKLSEVIIVPSKEDSLRIHVAHVLFENFNIKNKELFKDHNLDWSYIKEQTKRERWFKELKEFLIYLKKNQKISKKFCLKAIIKKSTPFEKIYLLRKLISSLTRKVTLRRKGFLISLMGVNGAGKSTITKELMQHYLPLTNFLGIKQQSYYFGWKASSHFAKVGSKIGRRKDVFKKVALNNPQQKTSLFQESLFIYNYIDYLYRYFFSIYPQLKKKKIIISDRYFYDLYGQYPAATKSKILQILIKIFPSPNQSFILDAPLEAISRRDKADYNLKEENGKRKIMNKDYLQGQRERFKILANEKGFRTISTQKEIQECLRIIVDNSWRELINKIKV